MENTVTYKALEEDFKTAIAQRDIKRAAEKKEEIWTLYEQAAGGDEKRDIADVLAQVEYAMTEKYVDSFDIFSALRCINGCRDLVDDFPAEPEFTSMLLQTLTGLIYLKVQMHEEGMVEEYTAEIADLAERFPDSEEIGMHAGACLANLIPLCGSFDAPLSLAYAIADRMEEIAGRLPQSGQVQTIYAHVLISACAMARQTQNMDVYRRYRDKLNALVNEKGDVLGAGGRSEIRQHMAQCDL